MRRPASSFQVIAAFALALAGCGGGSSSDAGSDGVPDGPPPEPVVVFTMTSDGNLGGRSGADAACATAQAAHPALAGRTVRALVCIDGPLKVSSFPTAFGVPANARVVSLNGTELASSWADLMDGPTVSLFSAGVLSNATQFVTGCGIQDGLSNCLHNCTDFTTNMGAPFYACVGFSSYTDETWIAWGNIVECNEVSPVLCVAYDPL